MIESAFIEVLQQLRRELNASDVNWAVTGSLGIALQGMDGSVHDIDIQTDRPGAYEIERRLLPYVVRSVEFSSSERIRSHFGELSIAGVKVEIMGDVQKRLPDGAWESPVDIRGKTRLIDCEGAAVPVMSLEYECEAYHRLGRTEKAQQIREYLERREGLHLRES